MDKDMMTNSKNGDELLLGTNEEERKTFEKGLLKTYVDFFSGMWGENNVSC